jgi:hypothetical protein
MINPTSESTDMEADLNSPREVRDGIVKYLRWAGATGPLETSADFTKAALELGHAGAMPTEGAVSLLVLMMLHREYEHLAEMAVYQAALAKAEARAV